MSCPCRSRFIFKSILSAARWYSFHGRRWSSTNIQTVAANSARLESAKIACNRLMLYQVASLAGMCQVALVGYVVGGAFLGLAYFDLLYAIFAIVVVTGAWVARAERGVAVDHVEARDAPAKLPDGRTAPTHTAT